MIKLIGLDYFGTVVCHNDGEEVAPFRNGFQKFLDRCDILGINVAITSDQPTHEVQSSLERYIQNNPWNSWMHDLRIDSFHRLTESHKDFWRVIEQKNIRAEELFVIGDDVEKDIGGAIDSGAYYQLIRPYDSLACSDNLGWGMTSFEQIIERNTKLFEI